MDSIEYGIVNWEPREVWHCAVCKSYRHRPATKGLLPPICCGQPAKLITSYSQPKPLQLTKAVSPG